MNIRDCAVTRSAASLVAASMVPLWMAAILFCGCATPSTFKGIKISRLDCRDGNGVHVACPEVVEK